VATAIGMAPWQEQFLSLSGVRAATLIQAGSLDSLATGIMTRNEYNSLPNSISRAYFEYSTLGHMAWATGNSTLSGDVIAWLDYYMKNDKSAASKLTGFNKEWVDRSGGSSSGGSGGCNSLIFDGGGNDVLVGEPTACRATYPSGTIGKACYDMIDRVEAINVAFWERMIADGVQNIVQQGYYYGRDSNLWAVGEVFQNRTIEEWKKVAAKHPGVKMIYVDPRTSSFFNRSRASSYTSFDGIHPTSAASEELADMVWDAMVANGIEQTDACSGSSSSYGGGCN
jgi:hypothetical protein